MKAIVWTKAGPPDVLRLQEVDKPAPKNNELLIRIHATTVTAADCAMRRSSTPALFRLLRLIRPGPVILGQELAGVIEATGAAVARFRAGDAVFAWSAMRLGAYAEYACLPESAVVAAKPANMTYEEAVPLATGGLDAAYFLKKADLHRGQRILIIGAGGSIGTFAVQLARHFGAEVTGVDSAGKLDLLRSLGAAHVIDYTREAFDRPGERYDAILDVVGKSSFSRCMRLLSPHGRYLLANPPLSHMVRGRLLSRAGGRQVITWRTRSAGEYAADALFLKELIEAGTLKSIIDRRYPLAEMAEAHRYVETGLKQGHVVVAVA